MSEPFTSAIAANRFGLGARPGELAAIGGGGRDWLRAQLAGAPPQLAAAGLRSSTDILAAALELRRELQAARKADAQGVAAPIRCRSCRSSCVPSMRAR